MNSLLASSIVALVPVKKRRHCKTRLADHLPAEQRLALVRSMLGHVVAALQNTALIERVIVLSPERDELPGSVELMQDAGWDLNSSLTRAIAQLRQQGVDKVLILPADLACLQRSDIDALIRESMAELVIAPSHDNTGTNALLLTLSKSFALKFGVDSFSLHLQQAQRSGLSYAVVRSPGLGFDMDTGQDLLKQHNNLSFLSAEYRQELSL